VGVATPWKWPSALDGYKADDLLRLQHYIRDRDQQWRADMQSGEWIGLAVATVFGMDFSKKAEKQRIKQMVDAWTKSGALKVVLGKDKNYKARQYVEVGELALKPRLPGDSSIIRKMPVDRPARGPHHRQSCC